MKEYKRKNKADRNRILREVREALKIEMEKELQINKELKKEERRKILREMGTNPKEIERLLDY